MSGFNEPDPDFLNPRPGETHQAAQDRVDGVPPTTPRFVKQCDGETKEDALGRVDDVPPVARPGFTKPREHETEPEARDRVDGIPRTRPGFLNPRYGETDQLALNRVDGVGATRPDFLRPDNGETGEQARDRVDGVPRQREFLRRRGSESKLDMPNRLDGALRNRPRFLDPPDGETPTDAIERLDGTPRTRPRSQTITHLETRYVNSWMTPKGPLKEGAIQRFYQPQNVDPQGNPILPKARTITEAQVETYKRLANDVVRIEQQLADTHVAFYTAQPPQMRIAQDLYKKVYERVHDVQLPADFHFLRYPGPGDQDFPQYKNVTEFLETDMARNGLVDDNVMPTKTALQSANLALHGSLGHSGEETFHYFQLGNSASPPSIDKFMKSYLEKFGLDTSGVDEFVKAASAVDKTPEGSIVQILVPKDKVDDVAYIAHPHGIPHDDDLMRDIHRYGPIQYGSVVRDPDPEKKKSGLIREKMNDEITRILEHIRRDWTKVRDTPADQLTNPRDKVAKELHERTLERVREGAYKPSKILDAYVHAPNSLRHQEASRQAERMQRNPEHFGGQGVLSTHEVKRIQNRPNFIQARLLMSENGGVLDPKSGIVMARHTTQTPEQAAALDKLVNTYVEGLFKHRELTQKQNRELGGANNNLAQKPPVDGAHKGPAKIADGADNDAAQQPWGDALVTDNQSTHAKSVLFAQSESAVTKDAAKIKPRGILKRW